MGNEIVINVAQLAAVIGALASAVAWLFRLLTKQYSERIKDKNQQIEQLTKEVKQLRN